MAHALLCHFGTRDGDSSALGKMRGVPFFAPLSPESPLGSDSTETNVQDSQDSRKKKENRVKLVRRWKIVLGRGLLNELHRCTSSREE